MRYPDFSREFIIATDASNEAIGAVLGQTGDDGNEYVVAYASKILSKTERNYSTTEREALAIYWGCKQFHPYLHNNYFRVVTDHNPLVWLKSASENVPKLMRWSMKINSYNFDIFYKSGKKHSNADAMSRLNFSVVNTILNSRMALPANVSSFKRLQRGDKTLSPIIDYLEKKHSHHEGEKEIRGRKRLWRREIENFIIDKSTGLLYHLLHDNPHTSREDVIWQIVIPRALVPEILFLNHDHPLAGHLGTTKTYYRIRRQYFWKNMYAEVDNYCQSCEACATRRLGSPRPIAPLGTLPAVSYPFERIAVDVVGRFPRTNKGNRVLVVFVDHFTKWPEAFAVPNQEAKTIARLLVTEIISRYSIPRELLSDRGTNFLSKIV